MKNKKEIKGSTCENQFRAAYENRYTWEPGFKGYRGECSFEKGNKFFQGVFSLSSDLKVNVNGIEEEITKKLIESQLFEVAIHRIRRPFEKTHGKNTFEIGDINNIGMEVIVGGGSKGDRYRINKDIITMVYRHIHGKLIKIFTKEITKTGKGYLSKSYTSEYLDPSSKEKLAAKRTFEDQFKCLDKDGTWVLSKRVIEIESFNGDPATKEIYRFFNLINN